MQKQKGANSNSCTTGKCELEEIDSFIKSLMDHQEKLHFALGRGRKRASIGVHDLSNLQPPFHVKAVSGDTKFTPLAMEEPMSIENQIDSGSRYVWLAENIMRLPLVRFSRWDTADTQ